MIFTVIILSIVVVLLVGSNVVLWLSLTSVANQVASIKKEDVDIEKTNMLITKANGRISKVVRVQHEFMTHITSELKKAGLMSD